MFLETGVVIHPVLNFVPGSFVFYQPHLAPQLPMAVWVLIDHHLKPEPRRHLDPELEAVPQLGCLSLDWIDLGLHPPSMPSQYGEHGIWRI